MHGLVDQGNSLVVVDHTAITNAADQIIENGPGAGADGGQIDQGSPAEISHDANSLIAPFLTGKTPLIVRPQAGSAAIAKAKQLQLTVTNRFNLHHLNVQFPINCFSAVSGFSGAGKSTLIFDAPAPALSATKDQPAPTFVDRKTGGIRHVVAIDATPVGKNVRSDESATYTDILDHLRHLFASLRCC